MFETLTVLAVLLVGATVLANLPGRSGSSVAPREQARDRPAAITTATPVAQAGATSRPPGAGAFGNLVVNWSFEQDLNGWQVLGAADTSREPQGRTSGSCASVRARGPQPGRMGLRLPGAVTDAPKGSRYVASAWVRSTAPGLNVTVRLVGPSGVAEASHASAPTLPGLAWRRVLVGHTVAAVGTDLDLEVTADGVPAGDSLLVDEVLVRQG